MRTTAPFLFQHSKETLPVTHTIGIANENTHVEEDSQTEFIHDLWEGPYGESDCAGL